MPTVFTHALAGLALAPLAPRAIPRGRLALALAFASILPDVDVLTFALGIPYAHDFGHRGFSHSLAFALLAGWLVARLAFSGVGLTTRAWWKVFALLSLAAASHGLFDAMTNGGLGIGFLLPFDSTRFFLPWRPLQVSPIGLSAFVSGLGASALVSELKYLWLPIAVAFLIAGRVPWSRKGVGQ